MYNFDTAGASIIMLITQAADFEWCNKLCDVINLLTPILQAYEHLFISFSPFCKWFEDES